MFTKENLEALPDNAIEGALFLAESFVSEYQAKYGNDYNKALPDYRSIMQSYGIYKTYCYHNRLKYKEPSLNQTNMGSNLQIVFGFFVQELTERSIQSTEETYTPLFQKDYLFIFEDTEIDRIQELINELREEIGQSDLFEEDHRRRLLHRLEKLQGEIHKKVSDIDRIWGFIGDAGAMMKKFGEDAKPLTDRIRELVEIGWKIQSRTEKLPDDSFPPLLK